MRKLLLATAAAAAITATPAAAKDGSPYVGVEGGILFPENQKLEGAVTLTDTTNFPNVSTTNVGEVRFHDGYDVDIIGGYDFGHFRLEGELGYKHSSVETVNVNPTFISAINTPARISVVDGGPIARISRCRYSDPPGSAAISGG